MSTLKLYKSYSFKDKDPVIDIVRTMVEDEGKSYREIAMGSGVSHTTLNNWFNGKTKRPQYATIMAVARSMGYKLEWSREANGKIVKSKRRVVNAREVRGLS